MPVTATKATRQPVSWGKGMGEPLTVPVYWCTGYRKASGGEESGVGTRAGLWSMQGWPLAST
jgi:hypothetical protein